MSDCGFHCSDRHPSEGVQAPLHPVLRHMFPAVCCVRLERLSHGTILQSIQTLSENVGTAHLFGKGVILRDANPNRRSAPTPESTEQATEGGVDVLLEPLFSNQLGDFSFFAHRVRGNTPRAGARSFATCPGPPRC